MKQPLPNFPATPSFGESNKTRHRTSGASWTDSGYGSICGNPECMGNCYFCNQLATHSHRRSSDVDFQILPPSFGDTEAGYFNPATLVNRGNRGPMSSLHSTEDNYDIFEYPFPIYSPGNHSFDGCPPWEYELKNKHRQKLWDRVGTTVQWALLISEEHV